MESAKREIWSHSNHSSRLNITAFTLYQIVPDFNSLMNYKFLNWSILEAFADTKLNWAKKLQFVLGKVENIMGKENVGYQHFLLF